MDLVDNECIRDVMAGNSNSSGTDRCDRRLLLCDLSSPNCGCKQQGVVALDQLRFDFSKIEATWQQHEVAKLKVQNHALIFEVSLYRIFIDSMMSVFFGCKISLSDLTKTAQQPKISESSQEDQDWAGHGVLVGCPQLPPHLVSTNESERHLSEPIKATAPLAAQQSAPDLGRGCF